MIFRPKIFISSTFQENERTRKMIHEHFSSVGAEPLLYERELTPSVVPMAYRSNLLDADFMVLIIKNEYGTKTELGISGIHEEYKIAHNNKIPLHVYLYKNNDSKKPAEDNPLINELKKDGISYYYFNNDDELIKRLKETTFTIAKEIMISQIEKSRLPLRSIKILAGNADYQRAIQIVSIVESMCDTIEYNDELDWITTDIFTQCIEGIIYEFRSVHHQFINWKIDESLNDILKIANEFISHSVIDFTSHGMFKEYKIAIIGKIQVNHLLYHKNTEWDNDDYVKTLDLFFATYKKFKSLVQDMRVETDINGI